MKDINELIEVLRPIQEKCNETEYCDSKCEYFKIDSESGSHCIMYAMVGEPPCGWMLGGLDECGILSD